MSEERAYGYALEHAVLALPAKAATACFGGSTGPNCSSKGGEVFDIWLGHADVFAQLVSARLSMVEAETDSDDQSQGLDLGLSVPAALEHCAAALELSSAGFVVFAHGSSGVAGASLRLLRSFAGMGYAVLAPQSLANGRARSRPERAEAEAAAAAAADYWAFEPLYVPGSSASGRLVYSSRAEALIAEPEKYHAIYTDVFKLRASELAFSLRMLPEAIRLGRGVLLAGNSEGAMAVARFPHDKCVPPVRVLGIALVAWACERCYYAPCEHRPLMADNAAVPVFCAMGTSDPFFAASCSVAAKVGDKLWAGRTPLAQECEPELPRLDGSKPWRLEGCARAALLASQVPAGFVAQLESSWHDVTRSHDKCVTALLAAFFRDPADAANLLERLPPGLARARVGSIERLDGGRVTAALLRADDDVAVLPVSQAGGADVAASSSVPFFFGQDGRGAVLEQLLAKEEEAKARTVPLIQVTLLGGGAFPGGTGTPIPACSSAIW